MKIYKIVSFIFSVITILALIAYFFPEEGIKTEQLTLKFPSLIEVMSTEETDVADTTSIAEADTLTTEEILERRINALKTEKESEFMEYCEQNPARIYMPKSDITYLDPLFDALENARNKGMRIFHYGDSQLECDRISSVLREELQEKFGGNGVGLIPAIQTIPTYTLTQRTYPDNMPRFLVYGPQNMRLDNGLYGVMGHSAKLNGTATFSLSSRSRKQFPNASTFSRITIMASDTIEACYLTASDTVYFKESRQNDNLYFYTASLPYAVSSTEIMASGNAYIYGISLNGKNGVTLDNIPMRGCSGTIFTKISSSCISPVFRRENAKLIILQYGGNSVPYTKTDKQIENYAKELGRQIDYLKNMVPDARFLFIGPSDMSTNIDGEMRTYPALPKMVNALKQMADEKGIAFWDLYSAMGGYGSMAKWVESALAGPDYVHFTPKGARHVGHILYETIEFYHKFYRFRTGKDKLKLSADSTSLVIDSAATVKVKEYQESEKKEKAEATEEKETKKKEVKKEETKDKEINTETEDIKKEVKKEDNQEETQNNNI